MAIVDLPEGEHEYKFLVDGEWRISHAQQVVRQENNVIKVRQSDFEELENALLTDPNDKTSPFTFEKQSSGEPGE